MILGAVFLLCAAYLVLNTFGEEWRITRTLNVKASLKPWFTRRPIACIGVGKLCFLAAAMLGCWLDPPAIFIPLLLLPISWWFSLYFGRAQGFHRYRMAMRERARATKEISGDAWLIEGSTPQLNVQHFMAEATATDRELRERLRTIKDGHAGVQL